MPFSEKFTKAFWVHAIPVDVLKRRKGLTFRRGHQCPRPSFFLKRTELLPVLLLPDIPSCGEIKDRVHVHLQAQTLSMWGHSGWGEQLGKVQAPVAPVGGTLRQEAEILSTTAHFSLVGDITQLVCPKSNGLLIQDVGVYCPELTTL
jgi:hypothetical protein